MQLLRSVNGAAVLKAQTTAHGGGSAASVVLGSAAAGGCLLWESCLACCNRSKHVRTYILAEDLASDIMLPGYASRVTCMLSLRTLARSPRQGFKLSCVCLQLFNESATAQTGQQTHGLHWQHATAKACRLCVMYVMARNNDANVRITESGAGGS